MKVMIMGKDKKNINVLFITIGFLVLYQVLLTGVLVASYDEITIGIVLPVVTFFVLGMIVDGVVFYVIRKIQKKLELDEELKNLYRYREQELELYQNVQRQLDELREKRHEFANRIQTVYAMSEQDISKDRVGQYLADMEEEYKREQT